MASMPSIASEGGLSHYLQEIRKYPMLKPDEEFTLAKKWQQEEDQEAAHKMVTSHLRLVAKIAMGYRGYGLPMSEVVLGGQCRPHAGRQALRPPTRAFASRPTRMWWIRASIQEYILRSWSLVKMGTTANQKKLFFNLRKAKSSIDALEDGDLRPEQVAQIATKLGRDGGGRHLDEPPPRRRRQPQRADALGRGGLVAVDGLPRRRVGDAGVDARRARGEGHAPRHAARGHGRPQRPRAPHLRGAAPVGGFDHAGGAVRRSSGCRASGCGRSRCGPSRRCRTR